MSASMPASLSWVASAAFCAVLLSSCGSCSPQSGAPRMALDAGLDRSSTGKKDQTGTRLSGGEVLAVDERMIISDGTQDAKNRYPFAVMVKASLARTGETLKCTGVLVSPRVVLTAGHCVCVRHKPPAPVDEEGWVIDNSMCMDTVTVTTVIYHPREEAPGASPGTQSNHYRGEARPHPGLQVHLDARALVRESNADLAIVYLEEPVEPSVPPVRLASTEVSVGETILLAGYGYDATIDLIYGVRRFGQKRIMKVLMPDGDKVLFGPHGAAFTSGSGEPCLRQDEEGLTLEGISSRGPGDMPACTSVHPYRDWLDAEIKKARQESSAGGVNPE